MQKISAALVKAQKEFGPALKCSSNPHFKTRYADLAACIEAVVDALNNNGIALVQTPHLDERGVTVETLFVHESGEVLSGGKLHVPAAKQDPQGFGSALTYARRYGLMAACGIAPEDDDGNAATKATQQQRQPAQQKPAAKQPDTPESIAKRITASVKAGTVDQPAEWLASLDDAKRDAIWQHLAADTQDALTAVWPDPQPA